MRPFGSGSSDEDPYSVAGSGSSGGSSGNSGGRVSTNPVPKQSDRPPKLPPRDTPMPKSKIRDIYGPSLWARPAVPALTNLKKTPKKSSGGNLASSLWLYILKLCMSSFPTYNIMKFIRHSI